MAAGNRQKLRLLLEGREVPIVTASIHCAENSPITAMIDLVPLSIIKAIKPRTQVHLFVRDDRIFGYNDYHLAFDGDVIGRGFKKSASGERTFQIIAADFSQYWKETRVYAYNTNFAAGRLTAQVEDTSTASLQTEIKFAGASSFATADTATSYMIKKILASSNSDFLAGIAKVITDLSTVNFYYANAYSRLRIADRVIARSSGGLAAFFGVITTEEFLLNFLGTHGGLSSLTELLVNIMGLVFHEYVSVPFPSITPKKVIQNFVFLPDAYSLPPPKCNVVFPNQLKEFNFSDDFTVAPTRLMYRYASVTFTGGAPTALKQTVPIKMFPPSLYDYFYKPNPPTNTPSKPPSLLDAATLFKTEDGSDYTSVHYGDAGKKAVGGVALSPTLRDADFLTNDEAIRGVIPEIENFPPAVSALKNVTKEQQGTFFQSIGQYIFYKKRFAARSCTASLLFSPYLVPGFNMLILDNSDAGQTVVGKLLSITHQLSNQGHSTDVQIGYARDFDEVDALSGNSGEPPCPEWFDTSTFGQQGGSTTVPSNFATETAYLKSLNAISASEVQNRNAITGMTTYTKLNSFYQSLLLCDAVTDVGTGKSQIVSLRGASSYLMSTYKNLALKPEARDAYVRSYTQRPVPGILDAMAFVGAVPAGGGSVVPAEWARFVANSTGRFDGVNQPDQAVLALRRAVIDQYRTLLRQQRGFRG